MNYIKILETGSYLPEKQVTSEQLEKEKKLEKGYIQKRTGIQTRHYQEKETIEEMAKKAVEEIFAKRQLHEDKKEIGLIIVATTSSKNLMPGIANYVQKELEISPCICLDILAGCSGYINAFDIASIYLKINKIKKVLVIGVDGLSQMVNQEDIATSIILSDGAGATLLEQTQEVKKYMSNIQADGKKGEILTCKADEKITMQGKEVYKYAVTKTVENVQELLEEAEEDIQNIKYILPHQSNMKIMKAIQTRLGIEKEKLYTNIEKTGNTFCASIPIALNEMKETGKLQNNDKIILLGYGGGLNTGSILLEI